MVFPRISKAFARIVRMGSAGDVDPHTLELKAAQLVMQGKERSLMFEESKNNLI